MSYGQQLLSGFLTELIGPDFIQNYRPDWLQGMELDFYYERLQMAFEFQGDQHSVPTEKFGPNIRQVHCDRSKRKICRSMGIIVITVCAADLEFGRLKHMIKTALRMWKRKKVHWLNFSARMPVLYDLDREATRYRKTLINSFDSVSARRKGPTRKQARHRAMERYFSHPSRQGAAHGTRWENPTVEAQIMWSGDGALQIKPQEQLICEG